MFFHRSSLSFSLCLSLSLSHLFSRLGALHDGAFGAATWATTAGDRRHRFVNLRERERERRSKERERPQFVLAAAAAASLDCEKGKKMIQATLFFSHFVEKRQRLSNAEACSCRHTRGARCFPVVLPLDGNEASSAAPGAFALQLQELTVPPKMMLRRLDDRRRLLSTPTGGQRPSPWPRAPPTPRRSTAPSAGSVTRTMWLT